MKFPNKYLRNLKPYKLASHKIWAVEPEERANILKLDWNEATIPPSPHVKQKVLELVNGPDFFNLYPTTHNERLLELLSDYVGLDKEYIQYFASSDALHEYICKVYISVGDPVLILGPSYDNFRLTCQANGANVFFSNYTDDFEFNASQFISDIRNIEPAVVYICNPNNPTGNIHSSDFIESLLQEFSDTLFLIDEAYYEFSMLTVKDLVLKYDNILQLNRNNDAYFKDYIVRLQDLRVRNLKSTEKLMKRCFEFFDEKLKDRFKSGEKYAKFIQDVVDNLYFTQIIVNDEMNAFRVFETLNARGVQLSSADLLKNYLFALVDKNNAHSSHIEQLEDDWTRLTDNIKAEKLPEFIRYYWNAGHKAIRAHDVFKTIRREITSDKQVFLLIRDMLDYSDIYMALHDPDDETWTDEQIRHDIALLNLFQIKQPYSMLMTAKKNLQDTDFKKLLHTTVIICFRYNVICDHNANDQEAPFNSMAMLISGEKRMDMKLLASIAVEDTSFQHAFQEKQFPIKRNAKLVRYVLGLIEKFKGSTLDVAFDDESATIEHILPQGYDSTWNIDEDKADRLVNRLGNLCLLERKLNKELQNAPYSVKREVYPKSAYLYAPKIAENYPVWDESSIRSRQAEMAKAAVSIWRVELF